MFVTTKQHTLTPYDLTACWRGVFFEKQGTQKPEVHQDITQMLNHFRTLAETGRKVQNYITNVWRNRGVLISGEHALPKNPWHVRGKYDAICKDNNKLVLVEVKSAGEQFYEWYKNEKHAMPSHRVQLLVYYLIMREHYPDICTQLLYVNRKTRRAFTLDIIPTDEELCIVIEKIETLLKMLSEEILPPPAPAIENDLITGTPTISMIALTCKYHSLCLNDEQWYEHAQEQLLQIK